MKRQDLATNDPVQLWVLQETAPLDVVASWESLLSTYDALQFTDPITDSQKLEEFKWIVKTMNSFLTKIRTKLESCSDLWAMKEVLEDSFTPTGKVDLESRRSLAYQKLRQRWVATRLAELEQALSQADLEEDGRDGSAE